MSPISKDIATKLALATLCEETNRYEEAEQLYLQVLEGIDKSDRYTIGTLHINLGTNAEAAGRTDAATSFYCTALEILSDQQGEGVLQRAYAHRNMAELFWVSGHKGEALASCNKAAELFALYPETPASEHVYTRILQTLIAFDPNDRNR
jgi:tetratricopeptide (TPR) repeat protein